MMNIDEICSRALYRPTIYVPALKDELIRLRKKEQEVEYLRKVIRFAIDERMGLTAEEALKQALSIPEINHES